MACVVKGAPEICYEDLDFQRRPLTCFSSRGTPYLRWLRYGMPRLPKKVLNCVFYLYKDRASAESGDNFGGTGFLVGEQSKNRSQLFIYGVTNKHVAVDDGYSVIRLNTRDGGTEIFEFGPEDWTFIPQGDDVAISPTLPIKSHHEFAVVLRDMFVGQKRGYSPAHRIGVGEDVVMIGRFVDHDGGETNRPAARFGNISVMPTPVLQKTGVERDTYLVDMHSRTGYSGSPVFVYRTPGNDFEPQVGPIMSSPEETLKKWFSNGFFMLLGIHYGQFPEEWKITEKKNPAGESNSVVVDGAVVTGLSGMTLVAPAESINALLNLDGISMQREKKNTELRALPPIIAETAKPKEKDVAVKRDEMLRTMLGTPPQPRKQSSRKPVTGK